MEMLRTFCLSAAVAAALGFAGCECCDNDDAENEDMCRAVKPGEITSVNSMCVIQNDDPVDPAVEPVVWNGQKIGFCCRGCMPRWESLSAADKDAAVARAIALSPKK